MTGGRCCSTGALWCKWASFLGNVGYGSNEWGQVLVLGLFGAYDICVWSGYRSGPYDGG